jgi:hypothetical protein
MWKQHAERLNYFSLCLLACFPLAGMKATVILIIAFSFLSVVAAMLQENPWTGMRRFRELWLLLIPFLLIFIRTFVTDRSETALFYLEVSLSLLAFPLAFYFSPVRFTEQRRLTVQRIFTISTLVITLYGLVRAGMRFSKYIGNHKFWPTHADMLSDKVFPYYVRTLSEEYTGIHPTHSCIFLGISALFMLYHMFNKSASLTRTRKILHVALIALILLLQALLASRTPFIATMAAGILIFVLNSTKKIYALYALGSIILLSLALWFMVPSFSARFSEISFTNTSLPTDSSENSFNIRTGIYLCSMRVIENHWIWGIGPGQVQSALNECYNTISPEVYANKNYNTHNQFLDYWAGLGILGPISLLSIMVYTSVRNFREGNLLVPSVSLFFTIAFMTENLLSRQNGIVCFAFLTCWYFFSQNGRSTNIK